MKHISFVNGSPKLTPSFSGNFIEWFGQMLDPEKVHIGSFSINDLLKNGLPDQDLAKLLNSDAIVFVFPLYIDSIPSSMLEFLDRFKDFVGAQASAGTVSKRNCRVYAVVNCGFIEGTHTKTVLKIMELFTESLGLQWRFGVGIGAGEFMRETQSVIPLESKLKRNVYQALRKLKADIEEWSVIYENNMWVNPAFPKRAFIKIGSLHWIRAAKGNNLKKRALFARPYGH